MYGSAEILGLASSPKVPFALFKSRSHSFAGLVCCKL